MKVFLSWSGARSRAVAEVLNDWLRCVIQVSRPWISSRDLDRGSLWFGEINDQLKDTTIGIVCLTQENKSRPWILFEAGALAKGLSTSRVCTFLIDLEPKDIEDPLAQFNHTMPERDSVLSLVRSLNAAMGASSLDDRILEQVFGTYWPQFEERFKKALSETSPAAPAKPRPKEDVMSEILDNTRMLTMRLRKLENQLDRSSLLDDGDIPPPHVLREIVTESARKGMPIEMLLDRYRRRVPASLIKELYEISARERGSEKDS